MIRSLVDRRGLIPVLTLSLGKYRGILSNLSGGVAFYQLVNVAGREYNGTKW